MLQLSPWHIQIYTGCIIGALSLGWLIYRKSNMVGGILYFYLLVSCINTFFRPTLAVPHMGPLMLIQIPNSAAIAIMFLAMIPIVFLQVKGRHFEWLHYLFIGLAVLDSISVIFKLGIDQFHNSGFQLNPAQDGTFIATVLPLVVFISGGPIRRFKWPLATVMILAILKTKETTPIFGLGVAMFCWLWFNGYRIYSIVLPSVLAAVTGFWIGYHQFFFPNGRQYIWKLSMDFWVKNINPIVGAGGGTFFIYGPSMELAYHGPGYNQPVYVWLHNDWLQILFEYGAIGLLLAVAFYFTILKRTYKRPWLCSALVVVGATALTQMPLRQFVSSFFIGFLIESSFRDQNG